MVSRKKVQSEIKKAFRLPSNAAVMTMMAMILVCTAPALVSVIDDKAATDITYQTSGLTEANDYSPFGGWSADTPADTVKTFSVIRGSENDGTTIITMDSLSAKRYVMSINGLNIDQSVFTDDKVRKIVLTFDTDTISSIRLSTYVGNPSTYQGPLFTEVSDGVWEIDINSITLTRLLSDDINKIEIQIYFDTEAFPGSFSMKAETFATSTIAYGEIIVGATGVLLIVCAILATPWVGTTGLTVKRRR